MNCCIIVAHSRPEFLAICLEYIERADNYNDVDYIFALDYGYDKDNLIFIEKFKASKKFLIETGNIYPLPSKQSYNVLNALIQTARKKKYELIYYIEEDVFIGKDFFTFHKEVHKKEPDLFISILSKNVNEKTPVSDDVNGYYYNPVVNAYQGIGSCLKSEKVLQYIEPDFCNEYFANQELYCVRHYPNSRLSNRYSEQDGLISRIHEKNNLHVVFSCVPRCFHAGFYGYHRYINAKLKSLSLEDKIDLIRDTVFDPQKVFKLIINKNYIFDSLPCNLETSHIHAKKIN